MAANLTLENAGSSPSTLPVQSPLAGALRAARTTLVRWIRNSEDRRHLENLDDRLLRDLGFEPEDVWREARRPFWKPLTLTPGWDR